MIGTSGTLHSIRSAAVALAVSEKTIQRALRDGRIMRRGSALRGAQAAFLDLDEVRRACVTDKCRGGGLRRGKLRPVRCVIEKQLEDAGLSAQKVLWLFWEAALCNEADIDFMMYCLSHLVRGNHTFISLALGVESGGPVGDTGQPVVSTADPVIEYAARRLNSFASQFPRGDRDNVSFKESWTNIFEHCAGLPAAVEPAIVYDYSTSRAELTLAPCWTKEAPVGLLPIVCGKISCIRPPRIEYQSVVNEMVSDLARRLEDERIRTGEDRRGLVILTMADSSIVYLPSNDEQLIQLCRELGFSSGDTEAAADKVKTLVKAWRVVKRDVHATGIKPDSDGYNIKDKYIDPDRLSLQDLRPHARPSAILLAELFDVSRQTVSRWLGGGTRED